MAPKKIAILVGINGYEHCGNLNFAVQDIEAIRRILVDPRRGAYSEDNVHTFIDKESQKPHRANILRTITNMSQAAESGDEILFYFSGHGLTDNGQAYLVPVDGSSDLASETCVSLNWIHNRLHESHASRKIMIIDACHSGLDIGKPASGAMTKRFEESLAKMSEAEGFAVLSSCKASELSAEDNNLQHGIFSYYLQEGLIGASGHR